MIRLAVICIVLATLSASCLAVETGRSTPVWKDHPYLFIARSDIPGILDKAKKYDWAEQSLEGIRTSADKWLTQPIDIPPSTGRHSVTYICQTCKEPLKTLSPTQHQCPKCGKIYSGLPYDAHLYNARHDALSNAARDLGLAWLFFGKRQYAVKARDILLAYADKYASFPLYDNRGGQSASAAHISDQTLNEAIWLINIAWGYDLVLGAGVATPEQRAHIENDLLRASVATIQRYRAGKSNWQSWHNAGIMAAALALKDDRLVDQVLNDPECGYFFQMKNSILPDGAWWEGSWSYQFYSLNALLQTAEAARHSGIDLYTPELRKCLRAPLEVMMPNGHTPPVHDAVEGGVSASLYELAAARYGDPIFQDVIAGKRGGLNALLFGMEDPRKHSAALKSADMNGIGLAILRNGGQYLCLDYGIHGGGHGHRDKLAINYFTNGQVFAPDLGRGWPYNLPIHQEWYKLTLSHNTVTVDEQPQAECEGSLVTTKFKGAWQMVTARADTAYEGVRMKRTVVLGKDWLLDIFDVSSDSEHTYDWVWHGRGDFGTKLQAEPFDLKASHVSYQYLSNVREGDGSHDWQAEWTLPGGKVYGLFKGSPGRTAILCDAPDNPKTNTLHSVILRDRAKTARFVALFSARPMGWEQLPKGVLER